VTRARRCAFAFTLAWPVFVSGCRAESRAPQGIPSASAPVILFFGDSITRGMGLDESEAFPALIQKKLAEAGLDYRCVNAGRSGDTTNAALERLPANLELHPRIVFVELGVNDGFLGLNRAQTKENLLKIVRAFSEGGAHVIVAGTQFPHLQHPAYMLALERTIAEIAKTAGADLVPDLMTGVAGVRELNQQDGVHPTTEGQQHLADTAWPAIERAAQSAH
jgi:acyl-CoA thioesterase-1